MDLLAAIRHGNDDPIPRRLAIALNLPIGSRAAVEADFARLQREVRLIAPLVDGDREVIEFHCHGGGQQRPIPEIRLSILVETLRRQFHFSDAAARGSEMDASDCSVTPDDIGMLADCGFNRVVFSADRLATSIIRAARSEGFRSIAARVVFSACRPSGAACHPSLISRWSCDPTA